MSETVVSELWSELKRYISVVDRNEAAEIVVSILIDNDVDVEDIRSAFKGDSDVKHALTSYLDNDKIYEDEEPSDVEEYDDDVDDWEN